jgi:hypothetical protein
MHLPISLSATILLSSLPLLAVLPGCFHTASERSKIILLYDNPQFSQQLQSTIEYYSYTVAVAVAGRSVQFAADQTSTVRRIHNWTPHLDWEKCWQDKILSLRGGSSFIFTFSRHSTQTDNP